MQQLAAESSILEFSTERTIGEMPPESYVLRFLGRGSWKDDASGRILIREEHVVGVNLMASYPRTMPELTWRSPFYHPNVSASGIVCLGGYSTYWVPSLGLDNLCVMLWDMIRFHNYDAESPYNREAAHWAKSQRDFSFPLDNRPLRDRVANMAPGNVLPPVVSAPVASTTVGTCAGETATGETATGETAGVSAHGDSAHGKEPFSNGSADGSPTAKQGWELEPVQDVVFIESANSNMDSTEDFDEIIEAELVTDRPSREDPDILFID